MVPTPIKPKPEPIKQAVKEETLVSSSKKVASSEDSSLGLVIGGAAGGLVVLAGIGYLSYTMCSKIKKRSSPRQDEENEAG